MLQFMGSQRVGHDWATELNWTEFMAELCDLFIYFFSQISDSLIFEMYFDTLFREVSPGEITPQLYLI